MRIFKFPRRRCKLSPHFSLYRAPTPERAFSQATLCRSRCPLRSWWNVRDPRTSTGSWLFPCFRSSPKSGGSDDILSLFQKFCIVALLYLNSHSAVTKKLKNELLTAVPGALLVDKTTLRCVLPVLGLKLVGERPPTSHAIYSIYWEYCYSPLDGMLRGSWSIEGLPNSSMSPVAILYTWVKRDNVK